MSEPDSTASPGKGPRRAVVTGGGRGIGRSVALRLSSAGCVVCIFDVRGLAGSAATPGDGTAHFVPCDIRDREQVTAAMATAASLMGGIDLVVCCAHEASEKPVERITEEDWDAVMGTDLTGGFLTAQAAIPHLAKAEHPCIIHVSSIHGRIGSGVHALYSAAMAGLSALDRCLAAELSSCGIRACTISPYTVLTESNRARLDEPGWEELQRSTVLNDSIMGPDELAEIIFFVASEEGRILNACDIPVDGGMNVFRERPTVSAYAS